MCHNKCRYSNVPQCEGKKISSSLLTESGSSLLDSPSTQSLHSSLNLPIQNPNKDSPINKSSTLPDDIIKMELEVNKRWSKAHSQFSFANIFPYISSLNPLSDHSSEKSSSDSFISPRSPRDFKDNEQDIIRKMDYTKQKIKNYQNLCSQLEVELQRLENSLPSHSNNNNNINNSNNINLINSNNINNNINNNRENLILSKNINIKDNIKEIKETIKEKEEIVTNNNNNNKFNKENK